MKTQTHLEVRSQKPGARSWQGSICALILTSVFCILTSAPSAHADQQGYPYTFGNLSNIPNALTSGLTIAASNNIIPLRNNSGIGLQAILGGTNTLNTNVTTIFIYTSVDSTNFTTQPWAIWPISCGSTNATIANTNWNQLQLRGISALGLLVSNGVGSTTIAGGYITNWFGPTNVGVFPAGVDFNRPNQ